MIKFRGFRKDGKGWVEGYYLFRFNSHRIQTIDENYLNGGATLIHEIHPESLAMSTGLIDKNGKEIFGSIEVDGVMSRGGDVYKNKNGNKYNVYFVNGAFVGGKSINDCEPIGWDGNYENAAVKDNDFCNTIEIIGNQYQQ